MIKTDLTDDTETAAQVLGSIRIDNSAAQDALRQNNLDAIKVILDRQKAAIEKLKNLL